MLLTFCRWLKIGDRSMGYLTYNNILKYHSSIVTCSINKHPSSEFTNDEELKIVETVNKSSVDELKKYDIKVNQLKKLLSYRKKYGEFKTFDDILVTQDVSSLIKFCKSILSNGDTKSQTIKSSGKQKSLVTPAIDAITKKNIKKIMGLHVWGNRLCWALIDENKKLTSWNYKTFENPSKATLVPLINVIIDIISELPDADAYVMESDQYGSLSKLKTVAYSIYLQRQQAIAVIISILEIRYRLNDDKIGKLNHFYMLQARTAARQYNLCVGSETVSSESVVADILDGSSIDNDQLLSSVEPHILSQYALCDDGTREQLRSVLLVTLTFVNLLNIHCK